MEPYTGLWNLRRKVKIEGAHEAKIDDIHA